MGSLQKNVSGDPGELHKGMELNSSDCKLRDGSRRKSACQGYFYLPSLKLLSMWVSVFVCLYILSGVPSTSALQHRPPRGHPHPHPPRGGHQHPHSRGPLRPPHGPPPNARRPLLRPPRGGGGGGPPPRPARDAPHRLAPLKHKRPGGGGGAPHDLHAAAQTLYDLRGFHIPLGGQEETQRFLRQHNNDPFSRPSGFTPQTSSSPNGHNNHNNNDPRTAPLVFPSFYQPHKPSTETTNKRPQTILNIFGHTQHLSQTKYEPAGQPDTSHGGQQQFRPSQVDLAYNNNINGGGFGGPQRQLNHPQALHASAPSAPSGPPQQSERSKGELGSLQGRAVGQTPSQGTQILNYRAPEFQEEQQQQRGPPQQQLQQQPQKNQQEDNEPFIYVYDDEDYEEDEFVDKPQNQINNNRVTPTPPTQRGPPSSTLRSGVREPVNNNNNNNRNNFNNQLPPTQGPTPGFFRTTQGPPPTAKAIITTSQRPIPIHHNDFRQQNNFQNNNNFFHNGNQQQQSVRENPFFVNNHQQPQSPPPQQQQQQNNFLGGQDHRFQARPIVTTRPNVEIVPSSERKPPPDQSNAITPALRPTNTPAPERFRRPPIVQPNSPSPLLQQQQNHNQFFKQQHVGPPQQQKTFNQVVNLAEEEETEEDDSFYDQEEGIVQKLNPFTQGNKQFQDPPSRLRPVNTIVPKNRVPQEDIVLPPNFPFHDQNDKTQRPSNTFSTSTGSPGGRGDVLRFRPPTTTTTSSEAPPIPQRGSSIRPQPIQTSQQPALTSPPRSRTPTRGQTYQTTSEAPAPPSRVRGRPIRPNRPAVITTTTTTTTTTTPRPTFRAIATFSSTTPAYEDGNDEYPEDEYNNERVVDTVEQITQKQKGSIRPVFNNQIQEVPQRFPTIESPPQQQRPRVRPTQAPEGITPFPTFRQSQQNAQRVNTNSNNGQQSQNNNRGREQTTLESPTVTIKTTTGKPLYYAGKMLSKEGGVYAGQNIPSTHIYGSPLPTTPFNYVFKKVPESVESHEQPGRQNGRKNNQQTQQQQRGRGRDRGDEEGREGNNGGVIRGRGPTSSSTSSPTSSNSRLIHPSRLRPQQVHVSTTPAQEASDPPTRPSQRLNQSPKFVRPQSSSTPDSLEQSSPEPPKRKKVRPGKQFRQQPTTTRSEASHQTSEVVPIVRETVSERESRPAPRHQPQEDEEQPKRVIRPHRVRPSQAQQSSSTEDPPSSSPGAKLKTRRIRPRVQKPTQPPVETSSLIVEEIHPTRRVQQLQHQQQQRERDEESSSPAPPAPKKLRPRLRPNNKPTPAPEAIESVSIATQSSVKISRKPTEAPGRFSSRFREESVPVVLSTQATNAEEEDEDEPSRPPSRPTFKPKAARPSGSGSSGPKPKRVRPQQKPRPQPAGDEEDALPASIRLKPEDVLLNRKPARRIPPGSASDKLKALQERRNSKKTLNDFKKSTRNDEDEDEDVQDDNRRPHHRTIRRRKLATAKRLRQQKQQQQQQRPKPSQYEEDEEDNPQNDQPDLPFQNKREITSKTSYKNVVPEEQEEDEEEEIQANNEEEEYQEDEEEGDYANEKDSGKPRSLKLPSNRGRTPQEVTSDEARSVLGIKRPTSTASSTTTRSTSTIVSTSERVGSNAKRKSWDRPAPVAVAAVEDDAEDEYEGQEEEDYEGHHSHQKEVKVSTEVPPTSTVSVRRSQSTLVTSSESPSTTTRSIYSSTISSRPVKANKPRKNKLLGKLGTTSSTVVLSTSTSASTSVSTSTTNSPAEDEEEDKPTTLPSSTQASSLKARLRPNKKLLSSIQPRMNASQQRESNEAKRQSNLSKLFKLKTSSSTYSPISSSSTSSSSSSSSSTASSNKLFTMATEDPSLPLESIFPLKHKTS